MYVYMRMYVYYVMYVCISYAFVLSRSAYDIRQGLSALALHLFNDALSVAYIVTTITTIYLTNFFTRLDQFIQLGSKGFFILGSDNFMVGTTLIVGTLALYAYLLLLVQVRYSFTIFHYSIRQGH